MDPDFPYSCLWPPEAPFVEHGGARALYVSEFPPMSSPFSLLQRLRAGEPGLVLFRDPDFLLPTMDVADTIRHLVVFYGVTLADIGTSDQELAALLEGNLRLRAAAHLAQVRSGWAAALRDLAQFEKIRARLNADYPALGTTREEMEERARALHLAQARLLLHEVRLPHRAEEIDCPGSDGSLARLEAHLAQAGASPADLGFSAAAWEALKRRRLLHHASLLLHDLKKGLAASAEPVHDGDSPDDLRQPWRGPDETLALLRALLERLGETPAVLGLTGEAFEALARAAAG